MKQQVGMFEQLYDEAAARAAVAGGAFEVIRQALADHEVGQCTALDVVRRVRAAMQQRDDALEVLRRGQAEVRQAAMDGQP